MKDDNNVLDRSIYEDSLLFHLNADLGRATETEVRVYDELLENMMEELPYAAHKKHPDLLVHIRVSFDTMLERIEKRGRSYEQLSFDPSLYDYYKDGMINGMKNTKKVQKSKSMEIAIILWKILKQKKKS